MFNIPTKFYAISFAGIRARELQKLDFLHILLHMIDFMFHYFN